MENNESTEIETTTETTTEAPSDPSILGRLTPEEQGAMTRIRAESQQLLAKCGEHELLKLRIVARVEELDDEGQKIIAGITKRLGLPDGVQWHGLQDGTIRLVNRPGTAQIQEGGGAQPS
jgi:hypothetical protein